MYKQATSGAGRFYFTFRQILDQINVQSALSLQYQPPATVLNKHVTCSISKAVRLLRVLLATLLRTARCRRNATSWAKTGRSPALRAPGTVASNTTSWYGRYAEDKVMEHSYAKHFIVTQMNVRHARRLRYTTLFRTATADVSACHTETPKYLEGMEEIVVKRISAGDYSTLRHRRFKIA